MFRAMCLTGLLALAAWPGWAIAQKGAKPDDECKGEFGTSLHFEKSPSVAAQKALKKEKLVVVFHVSGDFEDPAFT